MGKAKRAARAARAALPAAPPAGPGTAPEAPPLAEDPGPTSHEPEPGQGPASDQEAAPPTPEQAPESGNALEEESPGAEPEPSQDSVDGGDVAAAPAVVQDAQEPQPEATSAAIRYRVCHGSLRHDGDLFAPGMLVDLPPELIERFVRLGVVAPE